MISLFLCLALLAPAAGDIEDCKADILREEAGLAFGGFAVGFYTFAEGDCCSTVQFNLMVDNNGPTFVHYELRVARICEGETEWVTQVADRAVIASGDFDILVFRMPDNQDNCNCTYKIDLYSDAVLPGMQLVTDTDGGLTFSFACLEACE